MVAFAENAFSPIFQSFYLTVLVGALSVGGGWWIWTQREKVRKRFEY